MAVCGKCGEVDEGGERFRVKLGDRAPVVLCEKCWAKFQEVMAKADKTLARWLYGKDA